MNVHSNFFWSMVAVLVLGIGALGAQTYAQTHPLMSNSEPAMADMNMKGKDAHMMMECHPLTGSMLDASKIPADQVPMTLTKQWLDQYTMPANCGHDHLVSYTIDRLTPLQTKANGDLTYTVTYSVQTPMKPMGMWAAGNGTMDGNWMRHKMQIVTVSKKGMMYEVTGGGTGGTP